MTLPLELWVDKGGRPRARWRRPGGASSELLTRFLEDDLGEDEAFARAIVAQARRKGGDSWKVSGNSHALAMGRETSTIEPLFGNSEGYELATRDLVSVVKAWAKQLRRLRG